MSTAVTPAPTSTDEGEHNIIENHPESIASISRNLPRPSMQDADSMTNLFRKLPHPVTPPALPTGSAPTRFMKSALASNVPLVAVTGGLSYLGSHIVARHLAIGHFVRALIPQGANSDFLTNLPGAATRLQLVQLRDPSAPDALPATLIALRGASTVVHAASFSTHGGKLSKHAAARRIVDSLKIALDAASTPGNVVTNFVYIGSEMAVFDPSLHWKKRDDGTIHLTEADWYDCSKPSRELSQPFAYAHTVAEMRLWARVSRRTLPFSVCSVIPSFVLGPVLSERHVTSTPSVSFLASAASGSLWQVPDFPAPPVDVRDVAHAVAALSEHHYHRNQYHAHDYRRHEVGGRVLLSAESMTAAELIRMSRSDFPQYKWTRVRTNGRFGTRFGRRRGCGSARIKGDTEPVKMFKDAEFACKDRLGLRYSFSRVRARDELGMRFRSVTETVGDTLKSLHEFGVLPTMEAIITARAPFSTSSN